MQGHTCPPAFNAALQQSRGSAPPHDGTTELWWDSEAELRAGMETDEGRAAAKLLLEDEAGFIDFAGSAIFMTEEHEIFGP